MIISELHNIIKKFTVRTVNAFIFNLIVISFYLQISIVYVKSMVPIINYINQMFLQNQYSVVVIKDNSLSKSY